jgi:hypothetical protein
MDNELIAIASALGGIVVGLLGYINHHRIRSNCCGKKLEVSIDISPTTPEKAAPADPALTTIPT